jgi:dihydrofolate reductase
MITLVFMTDPKRVVGGSSTWRNWLRMPYLPIGELAPAMEQLLSGEHVVLGSGSQSFYGGRARRYRQAHLVTRRAASDVSAGDLLVCNDPSQLVERYRHAPEDLRVLGGLSMWRYFLPHADRIQTAETYRNVPGDLVFDEWDQGQFERVAVTPGHKLQVCEYRRKAEARA